MSRGRVGVQGDPPGTVHLGQLEIRNLGPTQSVVVRGCDGAAQEVSSCAGTVLFEEGTFHQIDVAQSADVVLRSCTVQPVLPIFAPNDVGGVIADASGLFVYDSTMDVR